VFDGVYKGTLAAEIPLAHTKIESTVRDLGVNVEDALTLAEKTDV